MRIRWIDWYWNCCEGGSRRGHKRAACFFAKEDYRFTLHWLKPGAEKYGCAVHAWMLMTNHVHRLLTPDAPNGISQLMQSLGRRYAQYVNRFYKRSGSVWKGVANPA